MRLDDISKAKYPTVMLVDDNDVDNFLNERIIQYYGFAERVLVYSSSYGALAYLQKLQVDNTEPVPDIIFLDMDMPVMDGFKFMEEYNKLNEYIRDRIKVVMLTSSHHPANEESARAIPEIIAYYNKPLKKSQLEDLSLLQLIIDNKQEKGYGNRFFLSSDGNFALKQKVKYENLHEEIWRKN